MISGFSNTDFGFLILTSEQKAEIEVKRGNVKLKHFTQWLKADGGDDKWYSYHQFEYGKNREGYWDGEKMIGQVEELLDAAEHIWPEYEHVLVFDWSAALPHPRHRDTALQLLRAVAAGRSTCHDKMPPEVFRCSEFKKYPGYCFTREVKGNTEKNVSGKPSVQKEFSTGNCVLQCAYPDAPITKMKSWQDSVTEECVPLPHA